MNIGVARPEELSERERERERWPKCVHHWLQCTSCAPDSWARRACPPWWCSSLNVHVGICRCLWLDVVRCGGLRARIFIALPIVTGSIPGMPSMLATVLVDIYSAPVHRNLSKLLSHRAVELSLGGVMLVNRCAASSATQWRRATAVNGFARVALRRWPIGSG